MPSLLNADKSADLAKQLKNWQKKYEKLKKQKNKKAANTSKGTNGDEESSEGSSPGPESEDEPEDVAAERRHKSSFESRGIFDTQPPRKRLRRQGEHPASSPPPSSSAASGTDTGSQRSSRASSRMTDSSSQADYPRAQPPSISSHASLSSSDVARPVLAAISQRVTRSLSRSPHPYRNARSTSVDIVMDNHDLEYNVPLRYPSNDALQSSTPRHDNHSSAGDSSASLPTDDPNITRGRSGQRRSHSRSHAEQRRSHSRGRTGRQRSHSHSRGRPHSRSHDHTGSLPPSTSTAATTAATAAVPPFLNGRDPSGKPKAGDYESNVNKLIVLACHRYEVLIATDTPFPETEKQDTWAAHAWAEACAGAQVAYRCTDRIQKIITGRGSHARGTLRDKIRPLIASTYGFATDGTERAKAKNIARYTYLLDRDAANPEPVFHYKDVDTAAGFAHNTIVLSAINAEWFADPTSPGVKYMAEFAPIREVTLALVFTAIEFCLDQWANGTFKHMSFSEKLYSPKYNIHLKQVQDWSLGDPDASQIVRQRMYNRARRASGAAPPAAPAAGLATASRNRLRLELAAQAAADEDEEN
ncbi:hypothetical protein C2E23DRAFT_863158 [Lenzites betulinus]|nr:hypothetical protein C2E23DRAFT_863158 [Lenzites betulinus]